MWCICLQIIVFLYLPSVLFLCSVTPIDLFLHWLKVEPYVFVWYFSRNKLYADVCHYINSDSEQCKR